MSTEQTGDSPITGTSQRRGRPFRWFINGVMLLLLVAVVLAGLAAGSFLRFSKDVISLAPPANLTSADGIVALTGGSQRIDRAVKLLNDGIAKRLLISGVNPTTTGRQIQRLTSAEPALFECCVDIGHDAIDTRGNANEAALWVKQNGYKKVIVVTSNYHMPRSLMELHRVDKATQFIAYPVVNRDYTKLDWLRDPMVLRVLASEYGKFVVARLRHRMGTTNADGLRSSIAATSATVPQNTDLAGGN